MTQKVIKVGTSVAVVIPKKSLKELGLAPGQEVVVDADSVTKTITIRPPAGGIDRQLLNWSKKFIKRYRPALEALARQ